VNPAAQQGFGVVSGTGPFTWSFSSNQSGASLVAAKDHVPMRTAPGLSGVAQWQHWGAGQPVVLRDNHGNHELFTFGSPGAPSGKLHLLRSSDEGDTWSWVSPDTYAQPVDSEINAGVMSVAQDGAGTVHLLYFRSGYLDVAYYRMTLTYSAGAITGYTALTGPIVIPGSYNGDTRAVIRTVRTAGGAEVLAVLVTASDPGGSRLQGSMCITSTLAPASAADFKNLAGAGGAATRIVDDVRGIGGSHDHTILFAQLDSSRDLWVFSGNVPAEPGPTASTTINRVQLTATGQTWTPGTLTDGSTSNAWLMGIAGTARYVWVMFGRYADGQVRFARVNAAGGYEEPVASIPSPVSDARIDQTQFGVFTVNPDETRIWAIFTRDPGPQGSWYDFTPTAAYWSGSAWQVRGDAPRGDTGAISYAEGFASSLGWDTGVVGLMTKTDGTSFNGAIQLAAMRTPEAADGGTSLSSRVIYTAGPAGRSTDQVMVTDSAGASASATVTVP